MAEYTYAKLRGKIIEKYGTMREFAKAIDKTPTTLSTKMTGKAGLSQEDIEEWSQLLGIPVRDYGKYFFT